MLPSSRNEIISKSVNLLENSQNIFFTKCACFGDHPWGTKWFNYWTPLCVHHLSEIQTWIARIKRRAVFHQFAFTSCISLNCKSTTICISTAPTAVTSWSKRPKQNFTITVFSHQNSINSVQKREHVHANISAITLICS